MSTRNTEKKKVIFKYRRSEKDKKSPERPEDVAVKLVKADARKANAEHKIDIDRENIVVREDKLMVPVFIEGRIFPTNGERVSVEPWKKGN